MRDDVILQGRLLLVGRIDKKTERYGMSFVHLRRLISRKYRLFSLRNVLKSKWDVTPKHLDPFRMSMILATSCFSKISCGDVVIAFESSYWLCSANTMLFLSINSETIRQIWIANCACITARFFFYKQPKVCHRKLLTTCGNSYLNYAEIALKFGSRLCSIWLSS